MGGVLFLFFVVQASHSCISFLYRVSFCPTDSLWSCR